MDTDQLAHRLHQLENSHKQLLLRLQKAEGELKRLEK